MKKKKLIIIVTILFIIVLAVGATLAWLSWSGRNTVLSGTAKCFDITYTNGQDISADLVQVETPINENTFTYTYGMASTSLSIKLNDGCNVNGTFQVLLNNTTVSSAFTTGNSIGALKYAVVDSSSVTEGNSYSMLGSGSITTNSTINIYSGFLEMNVTKTYTVIVYVDGNLTADDAKNTTYTGYISAQAEQNKLPVGYTELDYIESTGTQYIDTGYALTSGTHNIVLDLEINEAQADSELFGSANSNTNWSYNPYHSSPAGYNYCIYSGLRRCQLNYTFIQNERTKYEVYGDTSTNSVELLINNVSQGTSIYTGTVVNDYPLALFGYNNGGNIIYLSKYKCYRFTIEANGVKVRDMIPCKQTADGAVGMYDLVNNVFYQNSGTGTFNYPS